MNNNTKKAVVVVALILLGIGLVIYKNGQSGDMDSMTADQMKAESSQTDTSSSTPKTEGVLETNKVTYKGFDVVQKHIKVKKGTTVTWTNEDTAKHDVTPDDESAFTATELFGKGESASITFNTVGTFGYHCSPHPYMKGTVEVVE